MGFVGQSTIYECKWTDRYYSADRSGWVGEERRGWNASAVEGIMICITPPHECKCSANTSHKSDYGRMFFWLWTVIAVFFVVPTHISVSVVCPPKITERLTDSIGQIYLLFNSIIKMLVYDISRDLRRNYTILTRNYVKFEGKLQRWIRSLIIFLSVLKGI